MRYIPRDYHYFVQCDPEGTVTTPAGLTLATPPGDVTGLGTIFAAWKGADLPVGTRVLFRPYAGFIIEPEDGLKLLVLDQTAICGIIEPAQAPKLALDTQTA